MEDSVCLKSRDSQKNVWEDDTSSFLLYLKKDQPIFGAQKVFACSPYRVDFNIKPGVDFAF